VLLRGVPWREVEAAVLAFQEQVRGPAPVEELIVLDGKHARASRGAQIVTASTAESQRYLGSELVEQKSNEIPAARQLLERLDLEGRFVSLDALHTQQETARAVVQEGGGDYLLTVKDNQPGLRKQLAQRLPAPGAFPPSGTRDHDDARAGARDHGGARLGPDAGDQ
jgi:hypothetical protein